MLVAYKHPSMLPEGFLYLVLPLVAEVILIFRRVSRSKALSLVKFASRRIVATSIETVYESKSLRELAERVLLGSDLLEFYLLFTIVAPSAKELSDKEIRALLKGFGVEAEASPIRRDLYQLRVCPYLACLEESYSDVPSLGSLLLN